MKPFDKLNEIRNRFRFNSKSEWIVFLICFLTATLFWFLKVLDQPYVTTVNLPLQIKNTPEDKILSSPLPANLQLIVRAQGWDLLSIKLGTEIFPVMIDVSQVQNANRIITDRESNILKNKLPSSFDILDVYPDTLNLIFDELELKKVPVKLNAKISYEKQFGLSSKVSMTPEQISISGPASSIAAIDTVETKMLEINNLAEPVSKRVGLNKPDMPNLQFSQEEVIVHIPVEKLTEGKVEVPVVIRNSNYANQISLIPQKIKVSYQTPLSTYDKISAEDFQLSVDAKDVDTSASHPLKVKVEGKPAFIYNLKLQPQSVDYIIMQEDS